DAVTVEQVTVGVGGPGRAVGGTLGPVVPNPLYQAGRVAYTLPDARAGRLSVVDLQGREIAVLVGGGQGPWPHEDPLSPPTAGGRSGVYFLVLDAGDRTLVRRFTILH